jgi:cytoskeleton protein RodZ
MNEEPNINEVLFPQAVSNEHTPADGQVAKQTQQAWDLLREAREAKGVNLVVISSALKVPLAQLKALERGDLEALPDAVFARALVGSVCRHLGVDSSAILAAWPQPQHSQLQHLTKPMRMTPTPFEEDVKSSVSPRIVIGVVLLFAVVAAAWWLGNPERLFGSASNSASASDSEGTAIMGRIQTVDDRAGATGSETNGNSIESIQGDPSLVKSVSQAGADSAAVSQGIQGSLSGASAIIPTEINGSVQRPETSNGGESSPMGLTEGLLIHAKNVAWIEVRSASGEVLVSRNMAADTREVVSDGAPWSVVLGNATDTEIFRNGKAIDFAEFIRQGIARINVE